MCGPALLPALIVASTATTAAGQLQGAAYASQMARYRSQVADQNKARTHEAAMDEIAAGQDQHRQLGREVAARIGAQEARMAANNTDISFGSAARAIDDTKLIGREDSDALSRNIEQRVRGYQTDMWNYESERRASIAEGKQAKSAGMFSVASTVLGGATQYAGFKASAKGA